MALRFPQYSQWKLIIIQVQTSDSGCGWESRGDGNIELLVRRQAEAMHMGATSRRQCAAGLEPPNLYNTLPGCKDGIAITWELNKKHGRERARTSEPL